MGHRQNKPFFLALMLGILLWIEQINDEKQLNGAKETEQRLTGSWFDLLESTLSFFCLALWFCPDLFADDSEDRDSELSDPMTPVEPTRRPIRPPFDERDLKFDIDYSIENIDQTIEEIWNRTFAAATERWQEIIVGDLPQVFTTSNPTPCTSSFPPSGKGIDDVWICTHAPQIDGVDGILGSAGPLRFRSGLLSEGKGLPYIGDMRFDIADVKQLIDIGLFETVILHEMAHVLGIGTLWKRLNLNDGVTQEYYGPNAQAEWANLGCTKNLTVEMDGGPGTAFAHWDEDCLYDELMTGKVNGDGMKNPISKITIASLADLGYEVDMTKSDAFTVYDINPECCIDTFVTNIFAFDTRSQEGTSTNEQPPLTLLSPILSQEGLARSVEYGLNELAESIKFRLDDPVDEEEPLPSVGVLYQERGTIFSVHVSLEH